MMAQLKGSPKMLIRRLGAALVAPFVFVSLPFAGSAANGPRSPTKAPNVKLGPRFGWLARSRSATPPVCTVDGSPYFVGLGASSSDNVAGGHDSSVTAGSDNRSCLGSSGVAAGTSNTITVLDSSDLESDYYSFLGAGNGNNIPQTSDAFNGAGFANSPLSTSAFTGVGKGNTDPAGAFIGGGGSLTYLSTNNATWNRGDGDDLSIGAGDENWIGSNQTGSPPAFIGAGYDNNSLGSWNSIAGGYANTAAPNQTNLDSILGGKANAANGDDAVTIGGDSNVGYGEYSAIAGGNQNVLQTPYAIILGGNENTVTYTVYGFYPLGLAAGDKATALYPGSFVWADDGSSGVGDTAKNQFVARGSGGVTLYANEARSVGVSLPSGSGAWASLSDHSAKTQVVPLNGDSVLSQVSMLPVTSWRYTSEMGVRHIGPMAQPFYSAFGIGLDDRHITSIDEGGVALAAIQELAAKMRHRDALVAAQHREISRLRSELMRIEVKLQATQS